MNLLPLSVYRRLNLTGLCLALLILHELVTTVCGLKWLSLARMSAISTIERADACENLTGLSKRQIKICKKHLEVMDSVKSGASLAIMECAYQFRTRRWNCSTLDQGSLFGNVLNQGTREAAFVHALSSASVSHSVTKSCSTGQLSQCGCDRTVAGRSPQGFEWAGCSDNVAFGSAFSRTFVDARERARGDKSSRALMNLHNNEAGRRAVEDNMQIECKCHGVSGSCELKTCWRAMPNFRRVGEVLKEKFDGASEVQEKRVGTRRVLIAVNSQYKPHTDSDLVYLEASPDFCDYDPKTGSLGTSGRLCNKESKAIDGCDLMCCGRGFKTRRKIVTERCQCKFHWCCYVQCKMCKREVEEHICL